MKKRKSSFNEKLEKEKAKKEYENSEISYKLALVSAACLVVLIILFAPL